MAKKRRNILIEIKLKLVSLAADRKTFLQWDKFENSLIQWQTSAKMLYLRQTLQRPYLIANKQRPNSRAMRLKTE